MGHFKGHKRSLFSGLLLYPGFVVVFVSVFFFFLSFFAHHPARKIYRKLTDTPKYCTQGEEKWRAFEGPESWRGGIFSNNTLQSIRGIGHS